ncbi:MAG: four helix bundle protein [Pedosphaera sp.]|nr:four helix bundle protein [Pedosphaera sp.]
MKNEGQPPPITERTFDFAVRVVKLCVHIDEKRGPTRVLGPQILRAGTSVGANIEEAQGAQSKADSINKMSIALKEARETHFRLRVLMAAGVVAKSRLIPLVQEAAELQRIIGAIIVSSKGGPA